MDANGTSLLDSLIVACLFCFELEYTGSRNDHSGMILVYLLNVRRMHMNISNTETLS